MATKRTLKSSLIRPENIAPTVHLLALLLNILLLYTRVYFPAFVKHNSLAVIFPSALSSLLKTGLRSQFRLATMTPLFPLCTYRGYYSPLMDLDPLRSGYINFNPAALPPHPFSPSSRSITSTDSTQFGVNYVDHPNLIRIRTERYRRSYAITLALPGYIQGAGTRRIGELGLPTTMPEFLRNFVTRCFCCGRWVVWLLARALQRYKRASGGEFSLFKCLKKGSDDWGWVRRGRAP